MTERPAAEIVATSAPRGGERTPLWPYLVLVVTRIVFGANGYYPVLQPDEVIYREASRFFAGVGPLPNLADGYFFPMGYPLLTAPLWWLTDTLEGVGFAVLLLNALVGSSIYFPVRFLLRRLSDAPPEVATAAALAVGFYPAYFGITSMWATDNVFPVLFAFIAAAGWRLLESPTLGRAAVFGLLPAALYCVHERALLIVAVAAVQLLWLGARGHLRRREAALALGVLATGFAGVRFLMSMVHEVLYRGNPVERPLGVVLGKLRGIDGWIDVLLQAAGQSWYLLVATYGFAGIGVALVLRGLGRHRRALGRPSSESGSNRAAAHTLLFLTLSAGAVFATTIVYFPENPIMSIKPEFMFFGRICEGVLAVFLALGLAWTASAAPPRRVPATIGALFAAAFVLGAVMVEGRGMEALDDAPGNYGVFGVRWFLRDGAWQLEPLIGTLVVGAVAVSVFWLLRRRPLALVTLVSASFLWVSSDVTIHYMGRRLERLYSRAITDQVVRAGGVEAIAFDTRAMRVGRYAELIRNVEVHQFSSRDDGIPPVPLVLTYRDWRSAPALGARFLAGERDRNYALWALPGDEQRRLYRPPDPRTVVFGAQAIWSVWEDDFEEQELWRDGMPMRWSDGDAKLRIPLGSWRPDVLRLDIADIGPEETELEVEVNGRRLARVPLRRGGWSGDVSLAGLLPSAELEIELESGRSTERIRRHGFTRRTRRAVLVRGIALLDSEEAGISRAPRTESLEIRYQLEVRPDADRRWATPDAPWVLVATVENAGAEAWPGSMVSASAAPHLRAAWRRVGGGAAAAGEVLVPVPRPVLSGGRLTFPMALVPGLEPGDDRRVTPGRYAVELSLVAGVEAAADPAIAVSGPTIELEVDVLARRPGQPFAPLRLFARHDPLPAPPFVLKPDWSHR